VSVVANVAINVDSSGAVSKLRQVQQGAQATSQAVDKLNATTAATSNKFKIAANGIKYFTDAAGRTRAENGRFLTSAERAAAGIRNQGNAAQQAAGKLNGLRGAAVGLGSAFGGIAAVLGLIQAGRFVFAKTAEVQSQSRSLAILAGSAEKAGQIIKELQDLGAVTPFTSTELIDSAKRLQAFGVEADKVVETTRRLADASGATGAELSGLVTAYGQVQAKGRLQGEELLQFQERGIALQEELRKMYGMTGEEFQKALSKGQVSAKAVEVALQNLTNTGGKYANGAIAQSDTLNGRLSTLQDNVDGVAREVGKVLTPALIGILQQLNTSLSQTPAFVEDIALAFQYAAEQIAPFLNGLSQMQWFFTNLTPPGWAMQVIGGAAERGKSTIRGAASRQRQSRENSFIGPAAPQMQGPAIPERLRQKPNNLPPPLMIPSATGTGRKKGKTDAEREAELAAKEAARIAEQIRASKLRLTLAQDIFAIEGRLQQAQLEGNEQLALARNAQKELAQIASQRADIIANKEMPALAKKNVLNKLAIDAATVSGKLGFDLAKIEQDRTESFDAIIADLNLELALKTATTEQERERLRIEAARAKLQADLKGQGFEQPQIDQITGLQAQVAAPLTDVQKIDQHIGKLKTEIADLTSLSNIAITSAEGIGNAFAQSFQGLISGSMTAKEALGSFFKSVADMFLEMAAQIIAKQMTMIILQTILKALGAVAGGGGGGTVTNDFMNTEALKGFTPAANGATFANGIAKFANGGIVSSPTLFKFADGGTTRTGLMGEAGPEAIMPLKRGADGKLGVAANLDGAMSRYRRSPGTGGGAAEGGGTVEGGGAATGGPMAIDVRYSVERINDVEYVTASQFQAGMRQAAQQGAAQGEQRTLRRLQQSPSTRKRVGV
jgi:lambda family phage tail tape measure protein